MAAAKVQKVNNAYEPALNISPTQFHRLVKYFKAVDGWSDLQNRESRLSHLF